MIKKKKKIIGKFGRPSCSEAFNAEYRVYIRGRIEMRDTSLRRNLKKKKEKRIEKKKTLWMNWFYKRRRRKKVIK